MLLRLLLLICAPLCEPTELFLIVSPSQPIEGNSMTLACKTQPPPQKLDVQLQFRFYKDGRPLGLDWDSIPELWIPAVWREDSGSYWCQAKTTPLRVKWSRRVQIQVHGVPISNVNLEIQPPGGYLMEGEKLVLVCLVTGGTGDITFFWYKGVLGLNLETKTQRSLTATFEIPVVRESDSEQYYCAADNGYGPRLSELVNITVRIPVSHPVLTLRAPGAQAVVGDVMELHCEVWRGSAPILYQFYHEDVALGSSSAPSGGGVSFNLSLTAEHSGNYYCEANNGLVAQRSEVVPLNIIVPTEDRKEVLTSRVMEVLLGISGPTTMALLFCCWLKRKIGSRSAGDPLRSLPSPVPQESTYLNSQAPEQLHPDYENVNVVSGDEVYSLVYCVQQEQQPAAEEPAGMHTGDKNSSAIYSRLKKADLTDVDYEDVM
ncbi:Fc receptor-like protein 1 [Balaenoptera acutorostrata]|uniref:Fc receptor-like protein 1 n=1 Tax=Balaenoptera acutorostrata TaxID=9767 RepID=A0A383ZAI6_BALAC|nr:Fc receptor-like protein 1 [Balaenoptera acutorostrata]